MPYFVREGWNAHWQAGNHYGYGACEVHDGDEVRLEYVDSRWNGYDPILHVKVRLVHSTRMRVNNMPRTFIEERGATIPAAVIGTAALSMESTMPITLKLMAREYALSKLRHVRIDIGTVMCDNESEVIEYIAATWCNGETYLASDIVVEVMNDILAAVTR